MSLPPPPKVAAYPVHLAGGSLPIPQLSSTRNLINQALDVIDASTWTGDPQNAQFIAGQLRLLNELVAEARQTLKGGDAVFGNWWEESLDEALFDPPLPPTLAIHLTILDASLQFHFRTLAPLQSDTPSPSSSQSATPAPFSAASFLSDPTSALNLSSSYTGLSLRQRLGLAARLPDHDESDDTFTYRDTKVVVREKVRVESADPSLMSCMAKLSAVEHGVALAKRSLAVVMRVDDD